MRTTKIQSKRATLDLNPEQMAVTVRAASEISRNDTFAFAVPVNSLGHLLHSLTKLLLK